MDIHPHQIRLILPLLMVFALAEAFVYPRLARRQFPWSEAVGSIGVALGQAIKNLLAGALVLALFFWFWEWRLWTVPLDRWWSIPLLFLTVEFFYYWHHRLSHEIRWLWATHAVHHSPNHLNFFAALRLGWTGEISGAFLLLTPIVILGFHPYAVFATLALNLVYQFWIHSEWLPRLGILEGFLNTPSNHRVHHASNAEYLDRNYGGVTVIFDRLFGTYAPERQEEPCKFGLVTPLESTNPVTIALHEWQNLIRDLRACANWKQRAQTLLGPPGWRPDGTGVTSDDLRRAAARTRDLRQG